MESEWRDDVNRVSVNQGGFDPHAELEEFERARSTTTREAVLGIGSWWTAPILSTIIGGLTLYHREPTSTLGRTAGVVAVFLAVVLAVIKWRSTRFRLDRSVRPIGPILLVIAAGWVIAAAWGIASSVVDPFVPIPFALMWIATTGVFLVIRRFVDTPGRGELASS